MSSTLPNIMERLLTLSMRRFYFRTFGKLKTMLGIIEF